MSNLLATMKTERETLVKRLADHKADPATTARLTELKAEVAKLTAQLSGADLKSQVAALDRAINAMEHPEKVTRPMSEKGRLAIKEGLARFQANRKKAAAATPPPAPAQPTAATGEVKRK